MAYTGTTVLLPLAELGLTGSGSLAKVPPGALLEADNISFDNDTIRKEGGAVAYNSTAIAGNPRILAGWDWWPVEGVQRQIVYTSSGIIYSDGGSTSLTTILKTGLSGAGMAIFAEGGAEALANNRKLFLTTGIDPVQVLSGNGSSTTNLATPPADWAGAQQPVTLANHDGRMWGGMGHRVYYSNPNNHEDFTHVSLAGSLAIGAGHGERIVQIMSYKGLLLVWKYPTGIFYVDTSDADITNWTIKRLSTTIGGVSPMGAVQVSDDVMFMDQAGNIQLLSGIQEFGAIGLKNLSQASWFGPFMRENVNLAYLSRIQAVFYAHKLEAHIAIAGTGQNYNNRKLVIDFNQPGVARFRWSTRDTTESIWLRRENDNIHRPVIGDGVGVIYKLDQDIFRKGDTGYTARFQTPHMDFSWIDPQLATQRKNGQFLEIISDPTGNWSFFVDVYWDNVLTQTINFVVSPTAAVFGTFVLGTDVLGAVSSVSVRRRVIGSGKRVSFIFYSPNIDADFNVAQAYFSFTPSDERNI